MSYFNSLNDWSATQKAVEQHTSDAVVSYNNAKADADSKAFNGYSQLLESAGGNTTGLAGGYHLTRKIYKKYKTVKQTAIDAKNAVGKATDDAKNAVGKATDAVGQAKTDAQNALDKATDDAKNAVGQATDDAKTAVGKATGTDQGGDDKDQGNDKDEGDDDKDQGDDKDEGDDQGGDGGGDVGAPAPQAPTTPAPKVDNTPSQSAPEPANNGLDSTGPTTTDTEPPSAPAVDDDPDKFSRGTLKGDNQSNTSGEFGDESDTFGGDTGPLQQPKSLGGSIQNTPQARGPEPDILGQGGKSDLDNPEPELLGQGGKSPLDNDEPPAPAQPAPAQPAPAQPAPAQPAPAQPAPAQPAPAQPEPPDAPDAPPTNIEDGAKAFDGIKPTPEGKGLSSLGKDSSVDDIIDAGSSTLSDATTALSVGLDFLGPIGEVVGAGIAIGGFFHDLFGGSSEEDKEKQDESTPGVVSGSGGISSQSFKASSQTSLNVGTAY